jgi:hypothetical protein
MLVQPGSLHISKRLSLYDFSIAVENDRSAAVWASKYQSRERAKRKVRTRDFVARNRKSLRFTYPGNFIRGIPVEAMIRAPAGESI